MRSSDWSLITLITVCVAFLSNLFSPVICVHLHDLNLKDRPTIKSPFIGEKLLDDIDDQLNTDLMPPNFQPDPLFPIGVDDNFEDIGQLNKERLGKFNGEDEDDPFSLYIGNVLDSLPEASNIFDALRLNDELSSENLGVNLSESPTQLFIPILVNTGDDVEDSRNGLKSDTTLKLTKILLDSKHLNKSDKSSNKDHGGKNLIEKLNPINKVTNTTSRSKDKTVNPSESKEGIAIDEKDDEIYDEEDDSKKLTTKLSKFRQFDNSLYKWWSKFKSTTPKTDQRGNSKTTTVSGKTTTEKPSEDDDDDDDFSLSSLENSTVLSSITTKSSLTDSPTTHSSIRGRGKSTSTTIRGSKSNKSSTTSPTTGQSTRSDPESQQLTTIGSTDKPPTLTTATIKHSKSTISQTSKITETNKKAEGENADDNAKSDELIEDFMDTSLSTLNLEPGKSEDDDEDDKKITASTTTTSTTSKSEGKHSHKHKTTTATPTSSAAPTSDEADKSTSNSGNKSSKKSTTNELLTKSTIKPTTDSNSGDSFPVLSVTRSKSKSDGSTTAPSLTTHGRKTTRHSSTTPTSTTSKSASSTPIPTLHPYVEDSDDDVYLPVWNPDIAPGSTD